MGDVDYLYEDAGSGRLAIGPDDRAVRVRDEAPQGPSLSGPVPRYSAGMGGSTPHPALSVRPSQPVERHHTPEELMALADAMEAKMGEEHKANLARGPVVRDEGTPPSWLNEYMEKQPFTDPYHSPPVAPDPEFRNTKFYMSEEERKRYADYYKKHKKKK